MVTPGTHLFASCHSREPRNTASMGPALGLCVCVCVCVCVCARAQTGKLSHPMGPPLQAPSEKPGVVGGTDGKALLPQLESLLPSCVHGVRVQCADSSVGHWDMTGLGASSEK